ncbi:MAG: type II toxin-antitoxin system RelE/ParE family toxin [Candidatus Gracilibacteria bacterium]|nr:type II toxin-antitoxin system RelE/ParE family toxin [Candidatus Gracilibacteria bacterium]MDQ7022691.1 type II toxin-antitoxin system RelE/ParE family toxin [Candidatus Gracilibacteria bacterium]
MDYEVIFSLDSQDDLNEIMDYIERMTFSIEKANKIANEIISKTILLKNYPYMYQKVYKNYHSLSVKNKRIFYEIDDKRKEVIIIHILGGFQNYEDYL